MTVVFDPLEHSPVKAQGMMSSVIGPRPIAMISTAGEDGLVNVAPFSYFMPVTGRPLLIAVAIGQRGERGEKDTYRNILRTDDFVVNVTTGNMREHIETAAMEFPPDVSECSVTGWTAIPSQRVSAPSIAESPVHLECVVHQVVEVGDRDQPSGGVHLVLARIECIALDDEICTPNYHVHTEQLELIGRLGFPWFNRAIPEAMFELPRVPYDQFVAG